MYCKYHDILNGKTYCPLCEEEMKTIKTINDPQNALDRAELGDKLVDHTKIEVAPWVESNPVHTKDKTVGLKIRIPLDKVAAFFKKIFGKS